MEYQHIRSILTEHFKGVMERRKQRVTIKGLISSQEREGITRTHDLVVDALEHDNYEFVGTDNKAGFLKDGAGGRTRTDTSLRTQDFESDYGLCKTLIFW